MSRGDREKRRRICGIVTAMERETGVPEQSIRYYPFRLRPTKEPTVPLPIACRSTGHYDAFPGWHNPAVRKSFVELFWGIRGEGRFLARGREYVLRPGEIFVLYSGDQHHVTALTQWEYRWMTLDGQMPDAVVRSFGIGDDPIPVGPCPSELFARLAHEVEDASPRGQRTASATAYEILTRTLRASNATSYSDRQLRQCMGLIQSDYGNADLNVTALARRLGLHRTSLSKIFREKMGMSPVEYLARYRIGQAIRLLQGTHLSVHEIACRCGFSCPNYFASVVKKHTGMSPIAIRQMSPAGGLASATDP